MIQGKEREEQREKKKEEKQTNKTGGFVRKGKKNTGNESWKGRGKKLMKIKVEK